MPDQMEDAYNAPPKHLHPWRAFCRWCGACCIDPLRDVFACGSSIHERHWECWSRHGKEIRNSA